MNPIRKAMSPEAGFGARFLPFAKANTKMLVFLADWRKELRA